MVLLQNLVLASCFFIFLNETSRPLGMKYLILAIGVVLAVHLRLLNKNIGRKKNKPKNYTKLSFYKKCQLFL